MKVGQKKRRIVDGVELADNLYKDARGRPGYFRYCRTDRSFKTFQADSVAEANRVAEEANAVRDSYEPSTRNKPHRGSTRYAVDRYIAHQESSTPFPKSKTSWRNRTYVMYRFAELFPDRGDIKRKDIARWWETLTHHQQALRQAEFRRMFNYWMQHELVRVDYNPFTLSWDQPRLLLRAPEDKTRGRLSLRASENMCESRVTVGAFEDCNP